MSITDRLLANIGKTRADFDLRSRVGKLFQRDGVPDSPEVQRVLALPRREAADPQLVELLSAELRTDPSVALRPIQALALLELGDTGGLLAPIGVGEGKTLITALAPTLLESKRPLLLTRASLREKTTRDFAILSSSWRVTFPTIWSYEELGRADRDGWLEKLQPDLIMADEGHRLRNLNAAVTRRVRRYVEAVRPAMAVLSGTITRSRLLDLHHIVQWCTKTPPLPQSAKECAQWGRAVDVDADQRLSPGALSPLGDSTEALREGFGAHMRATPGVVASSTMDFDASIECSYWRPKLPAELTTMIREVQRTKLRPDGVELDDVEAASCEMYLGLGFWYGWRVPGPDEWMLARRNWYRVVRDVLEAHEPGLDSPLQVWQRFGKETPEGQAWAAVKNTFEPERVTHWVTRELVERIVASCEQPTLIWTQYRAVGEALRELGIRYYAEKGFDIDGKYVEDSPTETIALSISANIEGRNLQRWSRNLVLTPPANATMFEQLIGRTARSGQEADEITCRIWAPTTRYIDRCEDAKVEALYQQQISGQPQRLLLADWT